MLPTIHNSNLNNTVFDLFDRIWDTPVSPSMSYNSGHSGWLKYTTYQTEDSSVLEAALPGFDKEDISVEVVDTNVLRVAAERNEELSENRLGLAQKFSKNFRMSGMLDPEEVNATFKNGILKVEVKTKKPETKKIEIL